MKNTGKKKSKHGKRKGTPQANKGGGGVGILTTKGKDRGEGRKKKEWGKTGIFQR